MGLAITTALETFEVQRHPVDFAGDVGARTTLLRTGCGLLSVPVPSTPDLLDANEATWEFIAVDCVGCLKNQQVKTLATLVSGRPLSKLLRTRAARLS